MHPFYKLVRAQVEDEDAAWRRLILFAHDGEVFCRKCRDRICERLPAKKPPYFYRCALCDRGVPALGSYAGSADFSLATWSAWLDQLSLAITFGAKSLRRPAGVTAMRLRRVEAVRDEADRLVRRCPELVAATFGLSELPEPISARPRGNSPVGTNVVRLPLPEVPEGVLGDP